MCNSGAEMTLLNAGRFVGGGVGNVPKCPAVFLASASQNYPQVLRRHNLPSHRLRENHCYLHSIFSFCSMRATATLMFGHCPLSCREKTLSSLHDNGQCPIPNAQWHNFPSCAPTCFYSRRQ